MLSRHGCKKQQTQQTCLCYFFLQLVLIFRKATRITMQALVLATSQMMLSPIKSAALLDITSAISTQCCQHQRY